MQGFEEILGSVGGKQREKKAADRRSRRSLDTTWIRCLPMCGVTDSASFPFGIF